MTTSKPFPSVDHLFEGVPKDTPVIVAVSGGSDSIALLLLANIWARKEQLQLQAVTIDHGLRPEAAAEAAFVASVCAGLDIDHVTLAWEGMKPSFGIQAAARQSRYMLMDDFAHEIGANVILTGHTRNDQAETVLMRSLRPAGEGDGRGYSGMARQTWLYGGQQVFRPLLDVSRTDLRAYLSSVPQTWIEDPSNLDRSFERVRLRAFLSENPGVAARLERYAGLCARLRTLQAESVAEFLRTRCEVLAGPVYKLALDQVICANNSVFEQAVQTLIALAGGQVHPVSRKRLASVFEMTSDPAVVQGGKSRVSRCTIGGAVVDVDRSAMTIYRETRNQSSLLMEPGEAAIWDGRLHIQNGTHLPVYVEAAGRKKIAELEAQRGSPFDVDRRAALWSTPLFHLQDNEGGTVPWLPLIESGQMPRGLEIRLASMAIEHFCPEFDGPLRDWVASLDRYSAASLQP